MVGFVDVLETFVGVSSNSYETAMLFAGGIALTIVTIIGVFLLFLFLAGLWR